MFYGRGGRFIVDKINKNLIWGIVLCVLISSIIISAIKCKSNSYREIADENSSSTYIAEANYDSDKTNDDASEESEPDLLERMEFPAKNGIKVIVEGIIDVPAKFNPDLLAKYRNRDEEDIIKSERMKYAKLFTKKAGVTTIKIKNNKEVKLTDVPGSETDGGWGVTYSYLFFIPEIDSHIIYHSFFESNNYILTSNKTGIKQEIWNLPNISPKKNRFAVTRFDPSGDYIHVPAGITIFEIVSGNYIIIFSEMLASGWDNIRWLDNDTFIADRLWRCKKQRSCYL